MLHECRKQRRLMPLRAFVQKYARSGLLDAAPVWLVSPETVAVLFPQEPLFDRVIFDEASQCTVESGLPVLVRGAQAVIVGDEHQMPPSFFFTSRPADDETSEPRAVDTLVDAPAPREDAKIVSTDTLIDPPSDDPEVRDLLTSESLLTLARSRAPHVGLTWHYRCRSEELIAFSNQAFYAGSLLTIPAPPALDTTALRWVAVAGGRLERGRNEVEAKVVIDELARLLQRAPRPSVGLVTLNVQQRQALLDEIDTRLASDDEFASVWREITTSPRLDDRPFIKNLENVQGDERDVILLSPGHAAVERKRRSSSAPVELYVPARFGPIGQRGGERRLNVAISRARAELVVVASFDPEMLSVARSTHDGPRQLKLFLSYVFHTSRREPAHADQCLALARRGAPRPADSTRQQSHVQIGSALRREGHTCDLDVGVSSFRIPLTLAGSVATGRAPTAILTDEGDLRLSAFDRHVHRPAVLAARGWRVLRVTSREWARDPAAVLKRVIAPD
jgi:superfamily I DNA and/or RNA helicase